MSRPLLLFREVFHLPLNENSSFAAGYGLEWHLTSYCVWASPLSAVPSVSSNERYSLLVLQVGGRDPLTSSLHLLQHPHRQPSYLGAIFCEVVNHLS